MPKLYDVNASCVSLDGQHLDGAYDLIGERLTVDEIVGRLRQVLSHNWGLAAADDAKPMPSMLTLHIGPAGSSHHMPL
jgi:hypothetical protein